MTDQQFLDMAAQTDMLEAHLGQIAALEGFDGKSMIYDRR
jgi:hypothetical protein